jgi:hypothetical protein
MSNINAYIQTFAGGEFGKAMSARVNIDSYQASCEISENWFNKAQGPLDRRPPLQYIDSFIDSTKRGILKGFEFDVGQNYPLIITEGTMYFYLNDGILDIPTVTATIPNGTFTGASFASWTDASDSGASANATSSLLTLLSNGIAIARARTTFTVNEANVEHILIFDVPHGSVNIKIGTSAGDDSLLSYKELRRGHHRLGFTPTATGTHHLEFSFSDNDGFRYVDSISFLTGSVFTLPTPWLEEDLRGVQTSQDGDRLYMFHRDYASLVLERRGHRSWSLIYFEPNDGPFEPGDPSISMSCNSRSGSFVTITADANYFKPTDQRRLLRMTQPGQYVKQSFNTAGLISKSIKVSGIGADRAFGITITGTFTGTLTLERSVGNENAFSKVITFTGTSSSLYNDSYVVADGAPAGGSGSDAVYSATNTGSAKGRMDNQTTFYRVAVYAGAWTSGTAAVELSVNSGSQTGIIRLTEYLSATQAGGEVLQQFSRIGASDIWDISSWNDVDEWPNVTAFAHGRLWAFRRRQIWSSNSDDYFSFADGVNADQSVQLTLRSRSAEGVRWARELDFLCIGTRNEEYVIRSTSAAEPVGPTTAEPTLQGEEGGSLIEAAVGGDSIVYVHRNGHRLMQFTHNPRALSESSFLSVDLTRLNPESCEDGIVNTVIQQEPERRIYTVLTNGTVKPALFRREEEIMGWSTMTTQGIIEDAMVLREGNEDAVYFIVRRLIGTTWTRMLERMRSEVVLNDEDLVHLDAMLETPIDRPNIGMTPSSIEMGAVTVEVTDDAFLVGDVGRVIWVGGGRILINSYVNTKKVTGNVIYPLRGKLNFVKSQINGLPVYEPTYVPPGRWGIATLTSSVNGLGHLEGMTVDVWADMAYRGSAVVTGGSVSLTSPASRIFVGLGYTSIWKSLKIAYGATKGTAINAPKKVTHMGLLLDRASDTLLLGDTPGKLKKLVKLSQPAALGGAARFFSGEAHETFDGTYDIDSRIIIATQNPGPATIHAIIPNVQLNERA